MYQVGYSLGISWLVIFFLSAFIDENITTHIIESYKAAKSESSSQSCVSGSHLQALNLTYNLPLGGLL